MSQNARKLDWAYRSAKRLRDKIYDLDFMSDAVTRVLASAIRRAYYRGRKDILQGRRFF